MAEWNLRYAENTRNRGPDFGGAHSNHARHRPPSLQHPRKPGPGQDRINIRPTSEASGDDRRVISVPRETSQRFSVRQSPQDLDIHNLSISQRKGPKKRLYSSSEVMATRSQRSGSSSKAVKPVLKRQSDGDASPHSHAKVYDSNLSVPRRLNLDALPLRPDARVLANQLVTEHGLVPQDGIPNHGPLKTPKRQRQDMMSPQHGEKLNSPNAEVSLTGASMASPDPKSSQSLLKENRRNSNDYDQPEEDFIPMVKEPDARPISEDQLAAEVKGIYAGLVMVEAKCVNVVATQTLALQDSTQSGHSIGLHGDHWQALIALHRTLLHEHHDFFLASQHPSASAALRDLASRYSMPARMWKHGIHSFLELLRRRLPESLEYMITFIYLSYQMIALLYETVPSFEETWIECLGDLSRYRMAVEEGDMKDREVWTATARFWYSKASDINPGTGRLQHHLAILARNSPLQQLSLYSRSLCSEQPFAAGRDSILTVLEPVLGMEDASNSRLSPAEFCFIKLHGILFTGQESDSFNDTLTNFLRQLDIHIGRITTKWKLPGAYLAITNICALLKYGTDASPLWRLLSDSESQPRVPLESLSLKSLLPKEWHLFNATFSLVLSRVGDRNVLAFVHVMLVFLLRFSIVAYDIVNDGIPWTELASFLNSFTKLQRLPDHIWDGDFISARDPKPKVLPEDYTMRGQTWTTLYFPKTWFAEASMDQDERGMETQSNGPIRTERVIWLGVRLASQTRFLHFDHRTNSFSSRS